MRNSNRTSARSRGRPRQQDSRERGPVAGASPLSRWLAEGRGDALRHLGWLDFVARASGHLRTVMARAQLRDELAAMEAVLDGRVLGRELEVLREELGVGVVGALERLPSLRPELEHGAAAARIEELAGIDALLLARSVQGSATALDAALAELEDLEASLGVASGGGPLSVVELIGVAELCRACELIATTFELASSHAAPGPDSDERKVGLRACTARLREVAGRSDDALPAQRVVATAGELLARLDRAIDRRPEEPCIAADASPALAAARREVRAARKRLVTKADRMIRDATIVDALRERYWTERDGRVVLPVRSDRLGVIRSRGAIIHGSSATGHTFFVEPATLVEDNNALREAQLVAAEEERKVLRELSVAVAEQAKRLLGMQRACVALDFMLARRRFGDAYGGILPTLVDVDADADAELESDERGPAIELRAARHPAMLLDGVDVVPNDIVLEHGHALVISGPNAGGKTVALKTLGIMALMAAAGFALPCERRARLPVFAHLITDVGDDQSISANLSTFSAHVGHVKAALGAAEQAGGRTLVLLDEVAVGTDPKQGAALAEAILIALVEAGATVVATTHYDRLKLLATQQPTAARFHNAAVGFDLARLRPTFRLSLGVPGSSSAIAVARRLGLPQALLARAEGLLGDEGVKIDELLRDIEAERQSLARTRERLERDQQRLRRRDRDVRIRERRVLEGVRSRKAKAYAAAVEELRALESELKSKRRDLRRASPERVDELPTRAQLAGEARAALASHRAQSEADAALQSEELVERLDPRKLHVGDRVLVRSVGKEGEVVALSGNPPKRATVQLPNLRTTVKIKDLAPPRPEHPRLKIKAAKAAPIFDFAAALEAQAAAHFGEGAKPVKTSVDNVCDLRGERFADAQDRVADFVAEALARDQDVVLFRHGHGGGAVRKAVREALGRLDRVRRHRPGLREEGGDAVTVAWLE